MAPVEAWPEIDQRLWKEAGSRSYAAGLKPAALPAIAEGYGRWIAALARLGRLDGRLHPADRVTPDAVRAYLAALTAKGNKLSTINARLSQLGSALRILAPHHSFTWLHPRKLLRPQDAPTAERKRDANQWADWPPIDQQLWELGCQPGDLLDQPNHAARLRPASLHSVVVGYRRWLVFLRAQDLLDPTVPPAGRVTHANVQAYFRCLRASQSNASIIARLSELRSAMLIMHPKADFRWITSPRGQCLASLLPVSPRPIQNIDSKVLYDWGLTMLLDALAATDPQRCRIMYRNGLLIALFAARAPRVKSMASLRLGKTIIRSGTDYRLLFEHEDIKTGRRLEYDSPPGVSAAIDHYIAVVRTELSTEQSGDWFWLNQYGEPLGPDQISDMIRRKSKQNFPEGFGPHRF
jgi:site-specific recombinase XerD